MSTLNPVTVYQLRIRLDRISPLIWRRLLVTSETTIAELHAIIQIAFGWSDSHLHQFVIHGKHYGIAYLGGVSFADNPNQVRLADFRFRTGERFFYEYNFHIPWRHEIRVEQIRASAPGQRYPVCVGGARAAPPEECAGSHAFLALRQQYHPLHVIERLLALIDDPDAHDDPYDELRTLQYWAAVNRCNRRAINRQLRHEEMATSENGGVRMKLTVQLVIEPGDGSKIVTEMTSLEREELTDATLGLSLAEGKAILAQLQEAIVAQQAAAYLATQQTCPTCSAQRRCKGQHQIVVRSLFGTLRLESPRFRRCACQPADSPGSSSLLAERLVERTTPERRYLEAKWAALLPFGVTVDILEEVLPLQANRAAVYRHVQQVAERLEGELGDEQPFFVEGCQRDWDALPRPDGPLTVGIDGGYVHARDGDNRTAGWFELIVGKSVPTDGNAKCFGFVTSYDTKPKRRLAEVLKAQGLQMNQAITFLSDGGDNVRDLKLYLSPLAEHLLDWFHITMRITVMRQQLKELIAAAPDHDLEQLDDELERVKWYLWHGNVFRVLQVIEGIQWQLEDLDEEVSASRKLAKTVAEFHTYITANEAFIPNYGDRYRYGEVISTAFVESTVNQVISKRFVKKQQMRWTKKGAHLLLQVRTQVLNEDLRPTFERWYPAMTSTDVSAALAA